MYECKTCSAEFKTKKKCIEHMETCTVKSRSRSPNKSFDRSSDKSTSRSRSTESTSTLRRSFSTQSLIDLDKESNFHRGRTDVQTEKYNKVKSIAKKYKDELQRCKSEYHEEIEYLQSQLGSISEERDDLQEQVDILSEQIFKEKEKLRTEFNKKLADEKKKLASVYGGKTNLHGTIEKLQDDTHRLREEHENAIFSLNTQHQTEVRDLQDKLKQLKKGIENEKEDLARKAQTLQNEKAIALTQLTRDKDLEIETINSEKRAAINVLEMTVQTLRKDMDTLKATHQRVLLEKETSYQMDIKDKLDTISRLKDNHARNMDVYNDKKEGQIKLLRSEYEKKIAETISQYQIQMSTVEREKEITVGSMRDELERQKQRYEADLDELRKRLDTTRRDIDAKVQEKETEFVKSLEKTKSDQSQIREQCEGKLKRDYEEMISARDSTIIEIERLNHALGAQLEHYRSALESVNRDTNSIKEQFISNLNKQKNDYENLMKEKDEKIRILTDNMNKITIKHSSTITDHRATMASLSVEVTNTKEELKKAQDKLAKITLDHDNLGSKYREVIKKNLAELERVRQESISKLNAQRIELENQHIRKTGEISCELDAIRNELNDSRAQSVQALNFQRGEFISKIEKLEVVCKEKDIQLEKLRVMCEKLNDAGNIQGPQLMALKSQLDEETKKAAKALELVKERDQQLTSLKALNDKLRYSTEELAQRVRDTSGKPKEDELQFKMLRDTIAEKKKKLKELKVECEELSKENQQMEADLKIASAKEVHYKRVEEANQEKDMQLKKIRMMCDDQNKQIQSLTNRLHLETSTHAKELEKVRIDYSTELAKLTAKQEDREDAQEDIKELENQLSIERDRVKQLQADGAKKAEQIEQIRDISSKLNSTITGLQLRLKQQTEEYNEKLHKYSQEKSDQVVDTSAHEKILGMQAKYLDEIEKLTKENQELRNRPVPVPVEDTSAIQEKLKKMRIDCLDSMRKQKEEISQLKQDNIRINRDYKIAQEAHAAKEQTHQAYVSECKAAIQKLTEQNNALVKELEVRQERIHNLEQLLNEAMSKIMSMK